VIEKEVIHSLKKIRIRRALILGNFYDMEVQIIQSDILGEKSFVDTIIGITADSLLTKKGRMLKLSSIQTIYQL
jgi:hypothetical protein